MTTVDPYVIRIPEKTSDNNGRMTDEMRSWFEYDNRWKHDLWQLVTGGTGRDETGGTQESVADDNQIAMLTALVYRLNDRIQELEGEAQPAMAQSSEWNDISKSQDYDALPGDDITASNNAKINLPSRPGINSVIQVRNGDGSQIRVNGNGIKISYRKDSDFIVTKNRGTVLTLRYKIDIDRWVL